MFKTGTQLIIYFIFLFAATVAEAKTIAIFTYKGAGGIWDPDNLKTGITGAEESVIYMSQELVRLGHRVHVLATPPANSLYRGEEANPRFVDVDFDNGEKYDIAISWRMPNVAPYLKTRAERVYFWPHDTSIASLDGTLINAFDDVFWSSEWQREQWIKLNKNWSKYNAIVGLGIQPSSFNVAKEKSNPHSCIYASNYARGLKVLLDAWPTVKKQVPDATLDIYYGWQHWGLLSSEGEVAMRQQVAELAPLDVHEHGLVGHEELNKAYGKASLWTYPCLGWETFCISALRAQLSGAIPVIIEGSALKETVRHGYKCDSSGGYATLLIDAMHGAEQVSDATRETMGHFILKEYTWEAVAKRWDAIFKDERRNNLIN